MLQSGFRYYNMCQNAKLKKRLVTLCAGDAKGISTSLGDRDRVFSLFLFFTSRKRRKPRFDLSLLSAPERSLGADIRGCDVTVRMLLIGEVGLMLP